ncbi:MAG: UTP--glucose-1-phosphate uridylyltransferase [Deltaproteobacteria bacterium]|nr:UTP--glucose-1-phosphate uridylyltransferase [Deltaproteobacteria bacterium]
MDIDLALTRIRPRLGAAGLGPDAIRSFERMYRAFRKGFSGKALWSEIAPCQASDLVHLSALEDDRLRDVGRSCLGKIAWIVLNGGLGTSMKMERAKSLLRVKESYTFLDLISRHVLELRRRWGRPFPILFMNSFATRSDTLAALEPYPLALSGQGAPLPLDFLQHRFPRIVAESGEPFGEAEDREAWAPPGHGDLYLALRESGALALLLDRGVRWAFVSNADNLGATIHLGILGFLAENGLEFLMEVTPKTAADLKGGTLVRSGGHLQLLEAAQVPDGHEEEFADATRFPFFNTNNLWIDLAAVERRLAAESLDLPPIVNRKVVRSTPVVQLETAMGAAIGAFEHAGGVLVPRTRFAPVKTTDDLLVRRSDAYLLGEDSPLVPNGLRDAGLGPPAVRLDPNYYASAPDLDLRIPEPPSLLSATSLEVIGDVRFEEGVTIRGAVRVVNGGSQPMTVRSGTVLEGGL